MQPSCCWTFGPIFPASALFLTTKIPNLKDRRVQRTHQLLRQAFISLILERGYHAVTIRDVVKRAGVGRSTFYIHFGDLEELMRSHGDGQGLRRFMGPGANTEPFAFSRPFLEHANRQRRLWRALLGNKGGEALRKHFKEELIEIVREDLARIAGRQRPELAEATARYIAGAFAELVFWWLDSRSNLPPAEVDNIFRHLTRRALTKPALPQNLLR